jgi:carbonic anhydrase
MTQKFATTINCIDGRVQVPVTKFVKELCGVDFVDMITVPGADKVLCEYENMPEIESIKHKVLISLEKHDSKDIFIAGHHDCAANPVDKEEHIIQINNAVDNIKKWYPDTNVCGLWVDAAWQVKCV